jgi:hypothetical protein
MHAAKLGTPGGQTIRYFDNATDVTWKVESSGWNTQQSLVMK